MPLRPPRLRRARKRQGSLEGGRIKMELRWLHYETVSRERSHSIISLIGKRRKEKTRSYTSTSQQREHTLLENTGRIWGLRPTSVLQETGTCHIFFLPMPLVNSNDTLLRDPEGAPTDNGMVPASVLPRFMKHSPVTAGVMIHNFFLTEIKYEKENYRPNSISCP